MSDEKLDLASGGIRHRLTKGAVWTVSSRVIINLVALLGTFILARILTPDDFGLVAIATTIFAIITAVTDLSLSNALIQHSKPTEEHFHTAWTLNLLRAILIGAIFAAIALPVANAYDDPRLVPIILLLALSGILGGLTNPKMVVFARNLVFLQDFILQVSQKLAGFAVSVAIAVIYQSYWALVFGIVFSQFANIAISYIFLPYRPRFRLTHARDLFSFSLWLTLGQILNTINWRLDYLLLGTIVGRRALGYYSVADNLAAMPTREATQPFTYLLFPGLSRVADDPARIQAAYASAQALLASIALPVGIGFALCARPVVLLAMGEKWLPIVIVIQALSAIFALQTLGSLVQPLAMAKGRTRLLFLRDLMSFLIRIPLIVAGLLLAGLHGLIAARVCTGLLALGINLHLVRQLIAIPIWRQIAASGRSLISAMVMVGSVLLLQNGMETPITTLELIRQLVATMAVGGITYPGTHYLLWVFAGRGPGPEQEILHIASKLIKSFEASRA